MADSLLSQLGDLIGGSFSLNQEAFQAVVRLSAGRSIALSVVLLAGLSLAIGQSIILFANQVKPVRFIFSLLLNAVLFVFGFLFLVFSTWLIGWLPGFVQLPWRDLVRALGLSYAPLLFSFLGALPYLGAPILNLLSVWRLLAMVAGISAIAAVGGASAFVQVAFGWLTLHLLEGTIGQPIAQLGQRLTRQVAGVDLVRRRSELVKRVDADFEARLSAAGDRSSAAAAIPSAAIPSTDRSPVLPQAEFLTTAASPALQMPDQEAAIDVRLEHRFQQIPQLLRLVLISLGMLLVFLLVALLLRPIRLSLFGWYENLPRLMRWIFDLSWIGVVSLVFAGLLAPLETLGWWAGWYGDEVETHSETTTRSQPDGGSSSVARYVIYLDGVGQSGEAYTPDVVDFLEALQPALPIEMPLLQGAMMYSVRNRSLVQDRPLAWVWRLADKMRWENPAALLGLAVNVRNAWVVAISADKRYGPLYNRGLAQVLYNSLMGQGYQAGAGTPITLIGYSGGAQMAVATAPYLKRALGAAVEVISLGGVMSANNPFLKLEHLYHLVGDKDVVAALGPLLFPGRRKWFPLSYWNRARRKGKISEISLGAMGHQVPGGIMDPNAVLPSGETYLEHTTATILSILQGRLLVATPSRPKQTSNYDVYKQLDFNNHSYYPIDQTVDSRWYRPIAPWMGRLILPELAERRSVNGVWFEVHHAAAGYEFLVGQRVMLRWADHPIVQQRVQAVTQDIHFSVDAQYSSQYGSTIHPDRLNHWQQVDPLESLAGAHPTDDVIVMLEGAVTVDDRNALYVYSQPIEITGRYYGLVQFVGAIEGDRFQVRHFDAASRQFNGGTEAVRLPEVAIAPGYGSQPSTTHQIEQSPLNEAGWYIYGAKDQSGCFVVQAIAPRSLLRLQPDRVVFGSKASYRYIRQESWADIIAQKDKISSVLCVGHRQTEEIQAAIDEWQVGDRALLLHTYGGIGGNKKEPAAATPIFFGHFSFGVATVVHDPLSDERRFDISYYQVYTHNTDGITAGTLHWSRYMGDRQFGWAGTRPVCDILIKFEPFTGSFDLDGRRRSPLTTMFNQLEAMTARYRTGGGTGATYVGPANNCVQDSNQALFASIRSIAAAIEANQPMLQSWLTSTLR